MAKEKFTYKLSFEANDQQSSIKVMQAVQKLIKHVSAEDLALVADKVEKDPSVIQTAKKYL